MVNRDSYIEREKKVTLKYIKTEKMNSLIRK